MWVRTHGGDAATDGCWRVGNGADDGSVCAEVAFKGGDGFSGGNRQDQRFGSAQAFDGWQHLFHHLGLHRHQNDFSIGDARNGGVQGHIVFGEKSFHLVRHVGIEGCDFFRIGTGCKPALKHGAAHFASAHQNKCSF